MGCDAIAKDKVMCVIITVWCFKDDSMRCD